MWPSNHQQWSTAPAAAPNSNAQGAGAGGGQGVPSYQQQQWAAMPPSVASAASNAQVTIGAGGQVVGYGDASQYSYSYPQPPQQQQYQYQPQQYQQYQQSQPQQQSQAAASYPNYGAAAQNYAGHTSYQSNYQANYSVPQHQPLSQGAVGTVGAVPPPPPPNQQRFFCELCNISCPNEFSFQQHINSEKHTLRLRDTRPADIPRQEQFYCQICDVYSRDERQFRQHRAGEKHRKKVGLSVGGPAKTVFCSVCNVSCPDQASYEQHLKGAKHRKQVAAAEGRNDNVEKVFHCRVCNVSCFNDLAFAQHMNGSRHKKQVATVNGINGINAGETEQAGPRVCTVCNVSCPNELSFQQHLAGEKHRRKVGDPSVNDKTAGPPPQPVRCDVCAVSCPNEFSFQQHVAGEKHKKMVAIQNNPPNDSAQVAGGAFHCAVCRVTCGNEYSYQQHLKGKKHVKKVATLSAGGNQSSSDAAGNASSLPVPSEGVSQAASDLSAPASALTPPVTASIDAPSREILRPLVSTANVEEGGSDEEGEVDEEAEDIDKLYGELKGPESPQKVEGEKAPVLEDIEAATVEGADADPDIDDMFGDEDGEAGQSGEEGEAVVDGENHASEQNAQHLQEINSNEEGRQSHNQLLEGAEDIDMLAVKQPGVNEPENTSSNQSANAVDDEDDTRDMFGSPLKMKEIGDKMARTTASNNDVTASSEETKQDQPTVLDSGLGFVLDYSPDAPVVGTPEPHRTDDSLPTNQTPREESEEDEGDNDDLDMFGDSSDEESEIDSSAPLPANSQTHEIDTASSAGQRPEARAALTAADALAAARSRAKAPAKRAKILSAQPRHQPANLPNITPRQDTPQRSYYPPLHPDKYWSELRNWDFVRDLNNEMKSDGATSKKKGSGSKRTLDEASEEIAKECSQSRTTDSLPDAFDSVAQYKALWAPLLIQEAKAQLLSDVVAAQSSASTAWLRGAEITTGLVAKVELARSARAPSPTGDNSSSPLEPTVVVHIRPSSKGVNLGSPVAKNDLILFVHRPSTIERALRGRAIESNGELGNDTLAIPQGRLGFVGHACNHRSRSVDGLLVRVSQKHWSQFASLDELYVIRIGSNVTALREFDALSQSDAIPLTKWLLDGSTTKKTEIGMPPPGLRQTAPVVGAEKSSKADPLAVGGQGALPVGFRIATKSRMNPSQLHAITASASEYGSGGFTLIKGPPGTGKSTTLCCILNALHLRQYQEYYNAIERIVTESKATFQYEEIAALNRAAEVKPRILVCAPSNAAIDNVCLKIMTDRFVDGQGTHYSPSLVRVGAGTATAKVKTISLKQTVDSIIAQGTDMTQLDQTIAVGRQNLKRYLHEIQKLRTRILAMLECCPYPISNQWEVRIDEESGQPRPLFVNHMKQTTTFDIPPKVRPNETAGSIKKMPHYVSLLKNLCKYVERHNNENAHLEQLILVQNEVNARAEAGGAPDGSLACLLETHVLNSTHIILTTLGSAGGRVVKSAHKFSVVVVDEAAQSSEPSTLVALQLGSSHAILVGDPQQLPATIFSVSGRSTKYDRSLFQRLEECSHPVHLLNTQYRMDPVISEFPRHIFYQGMLLDGPNVQRPEFGGTLKTMIRKKLPYMQPFNILDLDSKEEREGTSLSNKTEAQLALHLYQTLDRETHGLIAKTRVAVITPYSQQSSLLHRLFEESYGASYPSRVEINTVDAFQGREAGVVIFSCVRAGRSGSGIGFLSDVQRMNVALTRAKHFLFVIARRQSIMVNPYWRRLVGFARSKNAIIHVPIELGNQSCKGTALKSSLVKSTSAKKVSFGATSERVYEASSNAGKNSEKSMFPDLTRLTPTHNTSAQLDASSDGECSA